MEFPAKIIMKLCGSLNFFSGISSNRNFWKKAYFTSKYFANRIIFCEIVVHTGYFLLSFVHHVHLNASHALLKKN
jgi:hypothetical protein